MGFFSNVGKFFKTTVAKIGILAAGFVAAPFTAGASIVAAAGAVAALSRTSNNNPEAAERLRNLLRPKKDPPSPEIPIEPTPVVIQPEKVVIKEEQIQIREIVPNKLTDITLYGFYSDINNITIPVDNDLNNTIVVPETFFPYIVKFSNHPPSNGLRYISQYIHNKIKQEWETNLGKVLYTLDEQLSVFPYITLDWQEYVDHFNNFQPDLLKRDGGVVFGFDVSPEFLLQWQDGPEPGNLLKYAFLIPKPVPTVFDLNPVDESGQSGTFPAEATYDDVRESRFERLVNIAGQVGLAYGVAKATLGGVRSIYQNTKSSIKNLSETATKVGEKFGQFKAALSKDAINGKISDAKNLIKTKLPTPKSLKKKFLDAKGEFIAQFEPFRKERLARKQQRRENKAKGIKNKFTLKNFNLPDLPEIPNIPSIPALPKKLTLANLNQLPGLGKLPDLGAIQGKIQNTLNTVSNLDLSKINLKDPMVLLNAPSNILNSVNSLADGAIAQADTAIKDLNTSEQKEKNKQLTLQLMATNPGLFGIYS
jgi:hypothetical protein